MFNSIKQFILLTLCKKYTSKPKTDYKSLVKVMEISLTHLSDLLQYNANLETLISFTNVKCVTVKFKFYFYYWIAPEMFRQQMMEGALS